MCGRLKDGDIPERRKDILLGVTQINCADLADEPNGRTKRLNM